MHYVGQLDLDGVTGKIAKTDDILLYVAIFSYKSELLVEVKVDIEYHRLCLCAIGIRVLDNGIFAGHFVGPTV